MKYTKADLARIQIDRAVELYLKHGDFVCASTLAGAAEEMLGNIAKAQGGESLLGMIHRELEDEFEKFSDLSAAVNWFRNELKHSRDNPSLQAEVEFTEADCALLLYRAIVMFPKVANQTTPAMRQCWKYLRENHQRLFG